MSRGSGNVRSSQSMIAMLWMIGSPSTTSIGIEALRILLEIGVAALLARDQADLDALIDELLQVQRAMRTRKLAEERK